MKIFLKISFIFIVHFIFLFALVRRKLIQKIKVSGPHRLPNCFPCTLYKLNLVNLTVVEIQWCLKTGQDWKDVLNFCIYKRIVYQLLQEYLLFIERDFFSYKCSFVNREFVEIKRRIRIFAKVTIKRNIFYFVYIRIYKNMIEKYMEKYNLH